MITLGVSADSHELLRRRMVGIRIASTSVWDLAQTGQPAVVDDANAFRTRANGIVQTLGLASFITIPLLSQESVLGVVICGTATAKQWDIADRDLAVQLTLEGSLLVDWARLREREHAHLADISYQANHDALTGLPNRAAFHARLRDAVHDGLQDGRRSALLLIDLNEFKQINDAFGHPQGDQVLQIVAARLSTSLRTADLLARIGGDEFAVLATTSISEHEIAGLAERLHAVFTAPFVVGDLPLRLRASIGIARFPDHGTDAAALLQHADMALYRAKRQRIPSVLYSGQGYEQETRRLLLLGRMRSALDAGEFVLEYQPIHDLRTGRTTAVEALVRWIHPEYGLLGPSEFIPLAENTALIHPLTDWVIDAAARQCRAWRDAGRPIHVSLNVSARDLRDGRLRGTISDALKRYNVSGNELTVEITETSALLSLSAVADVLSDLRQLGVRISIDDFGAGNTSLAHLATLAVDEIKLDASIVAQLESSRRSRDVLACLVTLSRQLGLVLTVEGVENEKTAELARESGCDRAQGYFFGRPQPAGDSLEKSWLLPSLP